MNMLMAAALSFTLNSPLIQVIENNDCLHIQHPSHQILMDHLNQNFAFDSNAQNQWQELTYSSSKDLKSDDVLLLGSSKDNIEVIGLYGSDDQFVYLTLSDQSSDLRTCRFFDFASENLEKYQYTKIRRNQQQEGTILIELSGQNPSDSISTDKTLPIVINYLPLLEDEFNCYFVNAQKMPIVISPKKTDASLSSFQTWAEAHQQELKSMLSTCGALLLRNFPVENAEDFATVVKSITGKDLLDYRGGEGSRKKIIKGVYTSTEAPPKFHIPLHNELSCTNHPASYICFYCDIAPQQDTGQTLIGLTDSVNEEMMNHPEIWNFFNGQKLKYISRHPPKGSIFSKINVTHKTWYEVFETNDKEEVEKICREKGFDFKWLGNWIELTRTVSAIHEPDSHFDHPYWFNQAHLYHYNPRIHGGWLNHVFANLIYFTSTTRQYDIELEDGTPIPKDIIYKIYDILDEKTVKFSWKKNDVLVLDNVSALHGRASCKGHRRILAAMVP